MPAHVIVNLRAFQLFSTLVGSVRRYYSTDGTVAGTVLLQTINGASTVRPPGDLGSINGRGLYFADNGNGYTVYSTDGTAAGTVTLVSAIGDPAQVVDIGSTGSLDLFSTLVGSVRRYYSTDGTVAGTVLLQTINGGAPLRPGGDLGTINGRGIYFADNGNGYTVYSTNGTVAGTVTLVSAIGDPAHVADIGSTGSLDLFTTLVGSVRRTFSTDGTVAGTVLLQTINGGAPLRPGGDLGAINGRGIYFTDNGNGYTVYSTDGTVAGTVALVSAIGNPAHVVDIGSTGSLDLFSTLVGSIRRYYSTDGTVAGTVLLQTINGASTVRPPGDLGSINGRGLYFADNGNGYTVYSTDGTAAGTVTLVSAIGDPAQVVDIGSTGSLDLFSTLVGSVRRYYSTDGTVAGTVLLQTINGGAPLRPGGDLGIIYGHGMYFADNGNGYTVYTTNGTVAGTATLLSAIGNPANVHGLGGMSYTNSSTTALVNVDENEAVAADIDTLTTVAGLTFLIQGGADAARFSINATTGILTFLAAPNYEAPDDANHDNVYDLIVRVTGGGATSDQALTIRVVNVNEAPAITSNGGGGSAALSIAENSVAVVTVTAVDPDAASTFTFQLAGGTDAALFRINAATGTLTFATAPDFERPADADNDNVYEVIVAVSDGLVQDMQSLSVRLNNIVESAAEGNFILGTAGNDVISASVTPSGQPFATTRDDVVFGNGGNDEIYGGPGVDSLNGGSGNDILGGDEDNDLLDGGEGEDRLYGWTGEDVLRGGAGRDQLLGDDGDDTLEGGADDDELGGWLGNDILDGGAGADSLNGWAGNDWYFVDNAGDQVFEAAGQGNDRVFASVSYTLTANAEVELMTTDFNPGTAAINLTGNERAQVIYGNDGANQLTGGGGGDAMVGLGGSDFFFVNDTRDVIYEAAGGGSDRVFAGVSYTLTAGAEVEMLTTDFNPGTAAINLTGNALAQAIFGNAGANQLNGGGGADTLVGFGGDDWYFIVGGNEGVVESAGGGSDRIFAGVDYRLQAGSEVELLTTDFNPGTAAINLTGNELANTIYGNAGDNVLDGKGGNDGLVGLGGADTFQFTTALGAGNVDFVYDFVHGTDKIALDDAVFGAGIGTPGTFNANAFHVGTAAHDLDDRILYNSATGQLYFDADGSGAGAAIQFATLGTGLALSASDFQVI